MKRDGRGYCLVDDKTHRFFPTLEGLLAECRFINLEDPLKLISLPQKQESPYISHTATDMKEEKENNLTNSEEINKIFPISPKESKEINIEKKQEEEEELKNKKQEEEELKRQKQLETQELKKQEEEELKNKQEEEIKKKQARELKKQEELKMKQEKIKKKQTEEEAQKKKNEELQKNSPSTSQANNINVPTKPPRPLRPSLTPIPKSPSSNPTSPTSNSSPSSQKPIFGVSSRAALFEQSNKSPIKQNHSPGKASLSLQNPLNTTRVRSYTSPDGKTS